MNNLSNSSTTVIQSNETSGVFVRKVKFNLEMCPDYLMGLAERAYDEAMSMLENEDGFDPSPTAMNLMAMSHVFRARAYEAYNAIENDVEVEVAEPFELTLMHAA